MGVANASSRMSRASLNGPAAPRAEYRGMVAWAPDQLGLFGTAAVAISVVDLTSKAVAQRLLHGTMVHINPALSLGHAPIAPELPVPAAVIGVGLYCALAWWSMSTRRLPCWPLAALLGGALGNLVDHAEGGGIVDFIRIGSLVFNLADVAILVGLGGASALGVGKLLLHS